MVSPAGELLSSHQKSMMLANCQIDKEYNKKKLHFVSDLKMQNSFALSGMHDKSSQKTLVAPI